MLIDNTTVFEYKHFIYINDMDHYTFYYFDYDKRDYSINMEFQHFHSFYEMMIPLDSDAIHLIEGKPYYLQINDIVLLAPSVLHKTIYPKGEPSKRIIISFMYPGNFYGVPDIYSTLLSTFRNSVPIFRFDYNHKKKLFGILNEILNFSKTASNKKTDLYNFFVHTKFQEFLYTLFVMKDENIYVNENSLSLIESKIYDITAYIHANYREPLSLQSLADQFFISPCYLSHQFKQVTQFSLMNYIQITRIRNVQYRLASTDEKISDIAFSCGFSSFSQFNRIFRKVTGQSPSQFRAENNLPR
jgi:AraC-like DNA-binding protein